MTLRRIALDGLGSEWRGLTVGEAIARQRRALPDLARWHDAGHEIRQAWQLEAAAGDGEDVATVAGASVLLLLSILARGLREYPYAEFDLDPSYFSPGDVHLVSLRRWALEWEAWDVGAWLEWLGRRWCIERHLHVALRKLRADNRDTFRIRPMDGELTVVDVPPVVFTSPRVAKAVQILRDLGLIILADDWWKLSETGRAALEECRG